MPKKTSFRFLIYIAILLAVFLPPFAKYQELRYRNKGLEREIKALKKETKRLEEEKRRLQTDISYVEGKAREKMGVVKKGEIVLKEVPAKR